MENNHHATTTAKTLRASALAQLQTAIDLIEVPDKADYLQALQVAPSLVATESDPMRFLRYAEYDVWAAARCLVFYWKRRREIFGVERAFRPLLATREGALTTQEVSILQRGSVSILPNDTHGRAVACVDIQSREEVDFISRVRTAYCLVHIMAENERSQTEGCQFIVLAKALLREKRHPKVVPLVFPAIPAKQKAVHLFNCLPYWPNFGFLAVFVETMIQLFQELVNNRKLCMHLSQEREEIIRTMVSHGFSREGLPTAVGGTCQTSEYFQQWLGERARIEDERYPQHNGATSLKNTSLLPLNPDQPIFGNTEEGRKPATVETTKAAARLPTTRASSSILTSELQHAVELLSPFDSDALMRAISGAPQGLWQKESNPDLFMRVEQSNADFAAQRLSRYWKLRFTLFHDKQFDPMEQTGEGALGKKDLAFLSSGFFQLLPNDKNGCPVLWIDESRLPDGSGSSNRDRCLFYMFSLLAENEKSQKQGAVLLYRMGTYFYSSLAPDKLRVFSNAFPLRFREVHLFSNQAVSDDVKAIIDFGAPFSIHVGSSKAQNLKILQSAGLKRSGLPSCVDGDYGYSNYIQWLELRTRMEWGLISGVTETDLATYPALRPFSGLPNTEKEEHARRLNVLYCRRKRYRILVDADLLRGQTMELQVEQAALRVENRRLEELVASANAMLEE